MAGQRNKKRGRPGGTLILHKAENRNSVPRVYRGYWTGLSAIASAISERAVEAADERVRLCMLDYSKLADCAVSNSRSCRSASSRAMP
jgi:hypothetical protein